MSLPFVTLQFQRACGDCGIAALAMLLGQTYEDVFAVMVSRSRPTPHLTGLYAEDVKRAARRLGVTLTLRRTWDLETSCGLLTVEKINKQPDDFAQHIVLLKFGLIFDTDAIVWEPETYFAQQGFRPVSLLVDTKEDV